MEVFSSAIISINYIYLIRYIFNYLKEVIGEVVKVDMEVDQCEEILVTEQYHITQVVVIFFVEIIKFIFLNNLYT